MTGRRIAYEMSQQGARCQYMDDEYNPTMVEVRHLALQRRDLEMNRLEKAIRHQKYEDVQHRRKC